MKGAGVVAVDVVSGDACVVAGLCFVAGEGSELSSVSAFSASAGSVFCTSPSTVDTSTLAPFGGLVSCSPGSGEPRGCALS